MRTLSLAILWAFAHAIAESVSIIHSYSFEGSPEPGFRIRAKEAHTFFLVFIKNTLGRVLKKNVGSAYWALVPYSRYNGQ